jgi:pyridoxamine 5'-phosphate oxidase
MSATLHEFDLSEDPIDGFLKWLEKARADGVPEHVAMTLSTASKQGQPSSRIVYFKGLSVAGDGQRCPRFFTNYESQKSREMSENPHVSLLFYWPVQWRQVRIEGQVEKVSHEESEAYFQSRARGSRIGAWASPQSSVIPSREDLEARVNEVTKRFEGKEIPCPPFWGGWRVIPSRVEFWQGGESRLHDREVFTRADGGGWTRTRLAP